MTGKKGRSGARPGTINRRQRRAAAAQAGTKDTPSSPLDLPLAQITLAKEGAPDKILTLSPIGLRDFITVCVLEHAHKQPIPEAEFEKLARTLRTHLTETLRHQISTTIIGSALMVVQKWYSPRALRELLEKLRRDPLHLMANADRDSFTQFVVNTIRCVIEQTGKSAREVIDWHLESLRGVVPRGRPDEEARSIFFESIVVTARQFDSTLALPPRDDSRGTTTTPLFEFGVAMRDLFVAYGHAMLDQQQLPHDRFNGFSRLKRKHLIWHLEAARRVILREKSMTYS
jgi:hypothetical protein